MIVIMLFDNDPIASLGFCLILQISERIIKLSLSKETDIHDSYSWPCCPFFFLSISWGRRRGSRTQCPSLPMDPGANHCFGIRPWPAVPVISTAWNRIAASCRLHPRLPSAKTPWCFHSPVSRGAHVVSGAPAKLIPDAAKALGRGLGDSCMSFATSLPPLRPPPRRW